LPTRRCPAAWPPKNSRTPRESSGHLTEQGALAYRAGQFQQAVTLLEKSLQADSRPGRALLNWLWLALANQRLGQPDEARHWLNKAQACLEPYRDGFPAQSESELGLDLHNWLEAHVLRREAEALIQLELSVRVPPGRRRPLKTTLCSTS
jgi:tetratricopeptide (TPR) repeat protein